MIFLQLFLTFLKIGAFTFGGGMAMLPLIQQEVLNHGWLTQEELINFVAISESTPGPFAVNVSTYVGFETGGILGAFCATFGVVFPSFVIILAVAKIYDKFRTNRFVRGGMAGLKPAVVGLIAGAFASTARSVFPVFAEALDAKMIAGIAIFAVMFVALLKKVNPIWILMFSAVLGIVVEKILG